MEHDLVLEGRVVTPRGLEELEVGVTDGIVKVVGSGLKGTKKIKTGRCIIFPGFIDIHVHLREPGWEHKEDFRTGTEAAIHGGVTTVADMPNNPKPVTNKEALDIKTRLAKEKAAVDVKFYGGISRDDPDGLAKLSSGVVGYKLYLSETTGAKAFPEGELARVFGIVARTSRPLSLHCEEQSVIDRMTEKLKGETRPDVYCDIRPPEAEIESVRKVISSMRRANGLQANVCHASTKGTLSLLEGARSAGLKVRCEAGLHHLRYNRSAILGNKLLKTNPPLRAEGDRVSLMEGLREGRVDFLVTDHAPHLEEEKADLGLAGVPGLDDYTHVVAWLIVNQGFDPMTIARVASYNPAKHLGLSERGEIAPGRRADFTVVDLHSPERVRREDVRSKCGWSPYEGKEFPGRARWAISEGRPLMDDFEIFR